MSEKLKECVREWLSFHHGDVELCARWMRDSLHVAGLRQCREWINEAIA